MSSLYYSLSLFLLTPPASSWWMVSFGALPLLGLVDPDKRKRSPTDSAGSPGSKESPSTHMEGARPQGLLLVPRLQLPHPTSGRGARHFDTRSLNEENFIASIGVYRTPSPLHALRETPSALPSSPTYPFPPAHLSIQQGILRKTFPLPKIAGVKIFQ